MYYTQKNSDNIAHCITQKLKTQLKLAGMSNLRLSQITGRSRPTVIKHLSTSTMTLDDFISYALAAGLNPAKIFADGYNPVVGEE